MTDTARIEVENVVSPGHVQRVDANKYAAMKSALLDSLPFAAPGKTIAELQKAVLTHLPSDLFPGGAKAGWWFKCVQLDVEAKGVIVRERIKPLRLRKHKRFSDRTGRVAGRFAKP